MRAAVLSSSDQDAPRLAILGTGLVGLAISRALATAGIHHVLVGDPPTETPRVGESLNAEGSLEIARQFPDFSSSSSPSAAKCFSSVVTCWQSICWSTPWQEAGTRLPATRPRSLFKSAIADPHYD
jgi:hypothetical protein